MDDPTSEWAAALPRRPGDRLRALAPAVLLLVVALAGVRNHIVREQSSWQGASFGMFATYDNDVSRTVLVTVETDGERVRVDLPSDLRDDARRLAVVPSLGQARSLARAVLERVEHPATVVVEVRAIALDAREDGLDARLTTIVEARAER